MKLKVMTWNIWSGKKWREIVDFVKDHDIEIMGFQEVDNNLERTGLLNITEKIAKSLGYFSVYSPSIEKQETGSFSGGQFGNCVISKFPILENKRHFLSSAKEWDGTAETEPRTLLEAKIKIYKKILCFMTLHLGYSKEFKTTDIKLMQIEKVIKVIRSNKDLPVILAGDLNSLPENQEISKIRQCLKDVDAKNTLKTWTMHEFEYQNWKVSIGLKYKLDYIFISDYIKHETPEIVENKISDHVPVIVTLKI